ncbi:WDR repeat protein putative transfer RNA methyltransferase [Scheffersomyces xylosifermentans]|uniref:WDR repeat protein putative transfer RNA methyltransferase n=1 Tax=Scheffersomyces xylosifermentans TaxID=1304137 RepID=UPI00315DFC7B
MKHPFQIVLTNKASTILFASVKNHLQVFRIADGEVIGSWIDTVDIFTPLKKQQEDKIKALKAASENKDSASDSNDGSAEKKLKNNDSKPIKIPKIPVPGPGAPPIYNYIRSLALSKDEKHLVGTTDSDKAAIIFEIDLENSENCLKLIKRQVFPKRPCAVSIDESKLIVADKFGDVYTIDIDSEEPVEEKTLSPILGHVSMLSDVLVASYNDKKFILTGDRDEHIRVSNYPKAYVIKNWLFGHHEFVSDLHIPEFDPSLLISGGGDDYLCLWKWYEDKLLGKIELRELIEPFLTEAHFPPERFLTPESPKEISVSKILTYASKSKKKYILVLVENTKSLLTFELNDDYTVTHKQSFSTEYPLIDITLNENDGTIVASLDHETTDNLLAFYIFNENDELAILEDKIDLVKTITTANQCDVERRDEFYPLYYINTLRKRSEH